MKEIEELYRLYFNDVYKYVLSISLNEHIAEDITQETFYKAMKGIKSFKGKCEVRVWLCQIAKNTYLSYAAKERNLQNIDDLIIASSEEMEKRFVNKEQAAEIIKVLDEMEEPYLEVFRMRYFGEMSFAAIGSVFGKSESWARVTFHRARRKVKERING